VTNDVHNEPTLLDWWQAPDNFSIAAWQSLTFGLALEVWHTGAVRSGLEHCASANVACTTVTAMMARLNIVAGYQNWEGYDAFVAKGWYLYWSAHQAAWPASFRSSGIGSTLNSIGMVGDPTIRCVV